MKEHTETLGAKLETEAFKRQGMDGATVAVTTQTYRSPPTCVCSLLLDESIVYGNFQHPIPPLSKRGNREIFSVI